MRSYGGDQELDEVVLVVDPFRSLAFPGSRHHPYEKATMGSFSMDEFLIANLFSHLAMALSTTTPRRPRPATAATRRPVPVPL